MKCLAFVDLHEQDVSYGELKKKAKDADFVVCAGDFTIFEHDIKRWMKHISELDGKVFLVHGNHESEKITKELCKQYPNIEFVHGGIVEYHSMLILGWGGGGFDTKDGEFEAWIESKQDELVEAKKKGKKIIFIAHAPFHGTSLDFLDGHHGNRSFSKFIRQFDIDYGFCGHFHENAGKEDVIRNCKVYNPGPRGKLIEIDLF